MKRRLIILMVVFALFHGLLVFRLVQLQILDQESYVAVTERQQRIMLEGADGRGTIYDRNMAPLTGSDGGYIYIMEKRKMNDEAKQLLHSIGAEASAKSSLQYVVYRSRDFDQTVSTTLRENYQAFIMKSARRYAEEQAAVHLVGYINEVDGKGACGIERDFDDILAQKQKVLYASADAARRIIPGLGVRQGVQMGEYGVVTTLNAKIQKKAEEILAAADRSGAIIVLEAATGEVLASASSPVYHPAHVKDYLESNKQELVNKAIQSQYPPGSIFKIIVAAAALESGLVQPEDTFICEGAVEINGVVIKCATGGEAGHGPLTFRDAFAKSCNSTFIQIGEQIGGEQILELAKAFGLEEKALGLAEEKAGPLPVSADIQGAGIGNLSLGQGKLLVTPVQVARMTAVIAAGGQDHGPSLIKAVMEDGKTRQVEKVQAHEVISQETAGIIKSFMSDTVKYGTANNLPAELLEKIAGKTGSAEAYRHGEPIVHGWFTGFMPVDDPQYIITVFVESGGSGRGAAVPLFEEMANYLNGTETEVDLVP